MDTMNYKRTNDLAKYLFSLKVITIMCSVLIIISLFLPWLNVRYTSPFPYTESELEFDGWDYTGWELTHSELINLFNRTPYLLLVFASIVLALNFFSIFSKKERYILHTSAIFSFADVVIGALNFSEINNLQGGDVIYTVEFGIYIILICGVIALINHTIVLGVNQMRTHTTEPPAEEDELTTDSSQSKDPPHDEGG